MKYNSLKIFIIIIFVYLFSNTALANIVITEDESAREITESSIKIKVSVADNSYTSEPKIINLKAEIGQIATTANPYIVTQTTSPNVSVSGSLSVASFNFINLEKNKDYTIHIINADTNLPYPNSIDVKTTGVSDTKAYLDGKLTVGDTTAKINYTVVTGGVTRNIALIYAYKDKDLNLHPSNPIDEVSIIGSDTVPAKKLYNLTGLTPDTSYDFWIIDTDTKVQISTTSNFRTLVAGAQPFDVYAGLGSGDCPEGQYCYLAPLGSKTSIDTNSKSIADYLGYIFKFGIGLAGVLAVFMLILAGIQYMGSDSFFSKEESKSSIANALIGLLIALASYLILNTLNPDLVNLKLNINKENIAIEMPDFLSDQAYSELTNLPKYTEAQYDDLAKAAAKNAGIEFCEIKAIMSVESRSNPGAIGHDEQVNGVSAHDNFIKSGITFLKQKIGKDLKNDDKNYCKQPGLCLDWRYSHGIGLMQLTFFPNSSGTDWQPRTDVGITTNPLDQLGPDRSIIAGTLYLKSKLDKYGTDIKKAFCAYNAGSCDGNEGAYSKLYSEKAYASYLSCKQANP